MRVFLCEFVTGGGMRGEPLPASLAREGAMMRDALARDLSDIPGVELIATHDDRLPLPRCQSRPIGAGDDPWAVWSDCAASADVAWPIAPETGGALARLAGLMRAAGAVTVAPDDEAIRIASSKRLTAQRLAARGVATPPMWWPGDIPPYASGPFVAKPDDGAGCEETLLLDDAPAPGALPEGHVVQPFVAGEAASLTVLRARGESRLLAVNRQHVLVQRGVFAFRGVSVAALGDPDGRLAALASEVAAALPGLSGIFGIDVVLGAEGPVVIEVNPRLTTAYAGLREALGANPVTLVEPFSNGRIPSLARREIEIAS